MSEKDKKTRKHFTRQFKRKVLLECAKGKKPAEILVQFGVDLTGDKKYAPKLINKWKKEMYKNMNCLALDFNNIDFDYAEDEIASIGDDNEEDNILDELLTKNNKNNTAQNQP